MPRYKFAWTNLPPNLLSAWARHLKPGGNDTPCRGALSARRCLHRVQPRPRNAVSRAPANPAVDISEFRSTQPGPTSIRGQRTSPKDNAKESELRKRVTTLTAENWLLIERPLASKQHRIRPIESAQSDRPLGAQK